MLAIINAELVMKDHLIPEAVLFIEDGKIAGFGEMRTTPVPQGCEILDAQGAYVGPGLVDIHTHTGDCYRLWQEPIPGCRYHLEHGTTTVLPASYPRMTKEEYLQMAANIREAMAQPGGENIGGMQVCGNVTGYYYGARGGSFEEDDKKTSADSVFVTNRRQYEQRQIRLTERLGESGVKLLCRHSALGLYLEGNKVVGILAFDGERELSIKADITVDATSDGHLIRMTEVKKNYGRPRGGGFVPFGVFLQYTKDGKLISKNSDSGIMDHYDAVDFSKSTVSAHANL